jgi:hypothetical protein
MLFVCVSKQAVPQTIPGHSQVPPLQISPGRHAFPQAPQCCVLVFRSAHAVVQSVSVEGHMHTPETQLARATHACGEAAVLQPPQWSVLVFVSKQRPGDPQTVRPPPQLAHPPPAHVPPVPQLEMHAPQFRGSLERSTHAPPHALCVPGQLHTPFMQLVAPVHVVPHVPQLLESDRMSMHAPPQRPCPAGHWHVPAMQVEPPVQRMPQAPQFIASDCTSMQAPPHIRSVLTSHSQCPAVHT